MTQRIQFGQRLRLVHPCQPVGPLLDGPNRHRQGNTFPVAAATGSSPQAGPTPILGAFDQVRPQRVTLDITGNRQEMRVFLDREALEPALVQVANANLPVVLLPSARVRHRQPLHEPAELSVLLRGQKQVPMIRHQAVRKQLNRLSFEGIRHDPLERGKILILLEDAASPDATIKHVEGDTGGRLACGAWHGETVICRTLGVKKRTRPAFFPPVPVPRNWVARVDKPQDEKELATLRPSRYRGKPYGEPDWAISTAHRLGIESSLRPVGRPKKEEKAE